GVLAYLVCASSQPKEGAAPQTAPKEPGTSRARFPLNCDRRNSLLIDGKIDSTDLDPVCRLAGPNYATLGRVIAMRPIAQTEKTVLSRPARTSE
ncbi:MAG: hypothetical protein ACREYA_21995, partial [Cupriavidus necator]